MIKNYLDYDYESLAENHIQAWKERYFGKSRQEVITDLSVNYDWSIEIEDNEVPEADIEEFEYEFTCEVLEQLGLNLSKHNKELLEECINATTGDVHEKLKQLYWDLVY